jgi:hypothetical protein
LEQAATEIKINLNSKGWPKGANVLSGRLDEVKTNLREIGIVIDKEAAKDPKTRTKTILIQNVKLCKQSFESLEPFAGKNQAQITSENDQNHAQNMAPSDANDANDTLHTFQQEPSTQASQAPQQLTPEQIRMIERLGNYGTFRCKICNYKDDKQGMSRHMQYYHSASTRVTNEEPQGRPWEI